jgi:putative toxin-antitoxin system antitoxin component (TIGR02293 family)
MTQLAKPAEAQQTTETVVWSIVYPPPNIVLQEAYSTLPDRLIDAIQGGLPWVELEALQEICGISLEKLAPVLGISKATLHRRKVEGRLGVEESDRVVRFARIMHAAIDSLETENNARQWLSTPQFGLGGAIPLHYAETEVGAREVEDLLLRVKYGVYS